MGRPSVARDRKAEPSGRSVVLRPLVQFAFVGITAVLIVGLATATASRRIGQREAITNARSTTLIKAQGLVEPLLTDAVLTGDPAAVEEIARVVEDQVLDEDLVRVKLWTIGGTIVYSDATDLIGDIYALG